MRLLRFFAMACMLLGCLASARAAQPAATEDLASRRQAISPITGPWLFHSGDSPAWSQPGFDDSTWPSLDPGKNWIPQGYREENGLAWFRFRLLVPAGTSSLVLVLPRIEKSYQLFAEGTFVGQTGHLPPDHAVNITSAPRAFTLPLRPTARSQVVTVALRLWQSPRTAGTRPSVLRGQAYAGEGSAVMRLFNLNNASHLLSDGGQYTGTLIILIVGLASLVLYLLTEHQPFYLWFTLFALISIANLPIGLASQHFAWSFMLTVDSYMATDFLGLVALAFVVVDLLHLPRSRALLPIALMALAELGIFLITWFPFPLLVANGLYFVGATAADVVIILLLLRGWRAGSRDAALLLFPYTINLVINGSGNLSHLLSDLHAPFADALLLGEIEILHAPFTITLGQLGDVVSALGMLAVLIYRFARTARERERLYTALAAAHDVQTQLIPQDLPQLGGLGTEISYMAAEEVGGDFCQVLSRPDGSTLIALGDVSGKGLRAAMLGTLCVGALRSMSQGHLGPARVLDRLNKAVLLTDYAGFITCLCAVISPAGELTLANAGHLSPYLNGGELPTEAGLPLGVVHAAEYTERTVLLPQAARLTILSDGVVEARSNTGELFGFDRTLKISQLRASEIADTARRHGPQQDDITVLTLNWTAPAVATAAA